MTDTLKPRDDHEVVEAVAWAVAEGKTLEVAGRGTKRAVGRAAQTDLTLDGSGIAGIVLYEPEELVLSAKPGTPLAEIEQALAQNRQELPFEPLDLGPLLGGKPGEGSIGGMLAANLSGPRRIKAGAARDHALGIKAVSGRGESFKAGGRVVKNVTGYDLPKLLAGSWGTLAVMTEITLKVLPAAEDVVSVLAQGLADQQAVEAMSAAMGTACDVSAAAHLPRNVAALIPVQAVSAAHSAVTAFRLEGITPSIAYRREKLEALLRPFGKLEVLAAEDSRAVWRAVRDVVPFADGSQNAVWRISTAPTSGAKIASAITAATAAKIFYDWAGGLLWVAMPNETPHETAVREALKGEGHATLIRASAAVRASASVFEPLTPDLTALTRRIKESFDPKGILNPGRMYAGV
jgi:glycolate oxidase FAD binding subunit